MNPIPQMTALIPVAAALLCQGAFCAQPPPASEDGQAIFKCKSETGAFTYQGRPCPDKTTTLRSWKAEVTKATPSAATVQQRSPATFSIPVSPNGTYLTPGSANSVPVVFQVDTGASYVSIPQEIAYGAGLVCRSQELVDTANGSVMRCEANLATLAFGIFTVQNVKAMIMPNLKYPLLGMNVLSLFHVEHERGIMKVTYKQ